MKNNRGITLVTLIGYIILSLLVISGLMLITGNFKKNFNELDTQSVQEIELDKINLQITKEIKDGNIIDTVATTTNVLTFKDGNVYTYSSVDKKIYLNNNITIAEHVTECKFEIIESKILRVTAKTENNTRVFEYAI